ncbi:c-type cytochrome biogenesis protein CcmI [Pseudomonas sp. Gutcm_11s]|uniref:c-type cytochrome biogenesis protein CcmI n=1 Tax=Pseudomonas sp. Gutcm_11s TaxID=3026088 RepID=UPI002360F429|nr:c-type cytochrome biogenesis protein CcmI [Pseudomonas sp. Gutcm_11s]MDD0843821.1 c-type cytochrome biogenesis protein CcmI [Pseudomonas sp. Gutcm_11s]
MIEFWLAVGLLLLVGTAFLLIPVLRGRRAQAEEDRTALNVALYQERLAELQAQREAGTLTVEQFDAGQAEAARELLADTEGAGNGRVQRLGKALPLLIALAVPGLAFGLYWHWGASQELTTMQDRPTMDQMTARLEQAVKDNPESAEAWYFLARMYMSEGRASEAARAYEQAVRVAGREPELLGQWAQALYFAGDKQWTEQLQALTDEALQKDAAEVTSLGLLGIAAFEDERFADAVEYWQRLLAQMPAEDPSRASIQVGIDKAREQLQASGQPVPEELVNKSMAVISVSVDLAPALKAKVQPGDAVFVFARAASGPPMPLAVKRLTVADLPAKVELSDKDAMMEQLKLSSFPEVQLVARISRSGVATKGEWVGRGQPIASSTRDPQTLLIDSPEQAQ